MSESQSRTRYPLLPIGISAGVAIGVAIGSALGSVSLGVAIGVALGVAFGLSRRVVTIEAPNDKATR
ncbi:hypothetical protein [Luteimonas terrae]|uniref:Glycine zipper-like domain-containing protein n=1 Tax=Luteimonas terrae TaxID=1530191 RepID=A0A4R5UE14_9GAMM|nr:hypothetical protein [Luteimonas terrae]TDK33416.1 hypothetical protein E2F49_05175 [Luteimonas terrae]